MAFGGEPDNYDSLLDDLDSINELTKFDHMNLGHDFTAMRRLQNERPTTSHYGIPFVTFYFLVLMYVVSSQNLKP